MSHGGDRYGNSVQMDFSVNTNPLGMPEAVRKSLRESWKQAEAYPDLQARSLCAGLCAVWKTKPENLLIGNGASEILMALVHAVRPKKALLPVPSFSGYEYVLRAADCEAIYYRMTKEKRFSLDEAFLDVLSAEAELLFLTNPNNPTGRYIRPDLLERILDRTRELGILVVLDECFMELSDDPKGRSVLRQRERWPNLLVLRAFTKSFAIPGIRLGYALCEDTALVRKIRAQLPEWNVSIPAQAAGVAALQELQWLEKARSTILHERLVLERALTRLGFADVASNAGYILVWDEKERGIDLYTELLKKGTLIRDCSDYPGLGRGYYRIAVHGRGENRRLIAQIREILETFAGNRPEEAETDAADGV